MTSSLLTSDTAILDSTTMRQEANDCISFHITLPSGRPLSSDAVPRKKGVAVTWCDVVRAQIRADEVATQNAEMEAVRRKREERAAKESGEAPPPEPPAVAPEIPATEPSEDPEEFIRGEYRQASLMLERHQKAMDHATAGIEKWTTRMDRWAGIAKGLGIDLGETTTQTDEDNVDYE